MIDLLRTTIQRTGALIKDAIDRVKAQVLSGLRSEQTDPNDIAGCRHSRKMAYGDHPYGIRTAKARSTAYLALTRDDIIDRL